MEAKLGKRVMPLETWENAANAARFREREGGGKQRFTHAPRKGDSVTDR
jgi:hypothetical protein